MNHGYSRAYSPVLRNPNLFHQNTIRSSPRNFPVKYAPAPPESLKFYQYPSPYAPHFPNNVPSPMSYSLSQLPIYPYSLPTNSLPTNSLPAYSYAPTASSKGLSLILIATLILVALDLVLVRPQKSRSELQGSTSNSISLERLTL